MASLERTGGSAATSLAARDPDELYELLAIRARTIVADPDQAGNPALSAEYDAALMGPLDDLRAWGQRFFTRFNADAYALVCGAGDAAERKKILDAFGVSREAVAGAMVTLIVGNLGLAPAIATVVVALVLRLFFEDSYKAMCDVWGQKVEKPAA